MLRTITIGSTLQIQGVPVGLTPDGRLMVRDGEKVFAGRPVPSWTEGKARVQHVLAQARDCAMLDAS
ncbi:hypothetical protein [Rhodobacter sp. SY28-1]|uniref:hypothetical protein n=1 Tax=Rhodobacter sp. SY28-1 TaxID=2562317 RepID=UPI0010C12EA9|nr:hypothetical protein [Rhodobacter sp. SY28-1]